MLTQVMTSAIPAIAAICGVIVGAHFQSKAARSLQNRAASRDAFSACAGELHSFRFLTMDRVNHRLSGDQSPDRDAARFASHQQSAKAWEAVHAVMLVASERATWEAASSAKDAVDDLNDAADHLDLKLRNTKAKDLIEAFVAAGKAELKG